MPHSSRGEEAFSRKGSIQTLLPTLKDKAHDAYTLPNASFAPFFLTHTRYQNFLTYLIGKYDVSAEGASRKLLDMLIDQQT